MTTAVIQTDGLVKTFGSVKALDGLDLVVNHGEVAGFLGPNGAGKSTTIRVLLGLLRPTGGQARVLDQDPWRDAVALHRRLVYVPGDVALWPSLTGGETIDLLGRLRGGIDQNRKKQLIQRFELDPRKKSRTYSKGNRQKIALIAALASDAELLLLDEPTSGLDPLMEAVFRQCITEIKDQGRSILLSSHILAEVERLCDTVTIIRSGRVVESGTLAQMRHLTRSTIAATTAADASLLAQAEGVHTFTQRQEPDGYRLDFTVDNSHIGPVTSQLASFGVEDLVCQPPSLEDVFLRHYSTDQGDGR
ncbi:MAG: ABC transporter ATP-binding protein [Micrococcales bacterium]|nr:ABC transporter ATP-binding protein [Micrococcales bacterium]